MTLVQRQRTQRRFRTLPEALAWCDYASEFEPCAELDLGAWLTAALGLQGHCEVCN